MTKKSKMKKAPTTQSKPKKARAAAPKPKSLVIPQAEAAGIRESYGKARDAGLEHNQLRREFLAFEKQAIETQTLYEREFNKRVEAAAQAIGVDPAQHTVNLQTMAFERRK